MVKLFNFDGIKASRSEPGFDLSFAVGEAFSQRLLRDIHETHTNSFHIFTH